MNNKKQIGSYYTPKVLSTFLVDHIFLNYLPKIGPLTVLEPSCGDGEFIQSLLPHISDRDVKVDLVEIDNCELDKSTGKLRNFLPDEQINGLAQDFLQFEFRKTYSLIIGNPPYISKEYLTDDQIEICKEICQPNISGEVKNIWPAFLIRAIENLNWDGVMCFVLPSELLQVKYTSGLRNLILDSFDRVEIFAFNELIFENAEQDVVAIIGIKSHDIEDEQGVSFYQVDKLSDLTIPNYTEMNFNVHRERLDKWTNYILSDEQLNTIDTVSADLSLLPIKHYCQKAEVGIVTAANSFFIRKLSELRRYNLDAAYIKPILQKSNIIHNTITITNESFQQLRSQDKSVNLVCLSNVPKEQLPKGAQEFVEEGESDNLHKRYKMTKRTHWYHVPSIWSSHAIFCKRSHWYPRIFLNDANVLVTDSFYRVVCKKEYCAQNLVFSFYNSLTLILAELEGRFYGGGVLELIPTEFKSLLIPYNPLINQEQYDELEHLFSIGATLDEILNFTDPILLPGVQNEVIQELREMRIALFNRRTKFQGLEIGATVEAV
ncbi:MULTISPECIES: Eco57I restriction-modification methylase domain-containing protein [unclassified Imperialibacter]|uniref:Eco57I restriction-modification methylase domain-containing protein n=1 Tax=unclassified Imperialibacter TaxID=2629706 RepID=UPI001252122C|nr:MULTISPECIES: N-6 DNA methylase [unclassified Imperialibacter]CAD5251224.1 Type I restriction endonuclease subunit M [Imperialibacter sp. 89]CAD5284235.1 Type I restriction endonuclease subunit M [Imperialibacter sp. 75]VVT11014.1 N-6 DNA methylase [Imperialibacter sp. EC-SDR9]